MTELFYAGTQGRYMPICIWSLQERPGDVNVTSQLHHRDVSIRQQCLAN